MSFILQPWQLFVAIIAGWIHRQQQEAIEYLRTENRVLIEPAQERKRQTTWATFLKAHWDLLGSIDFTTIEVWTKGGLVTYYLLFVMEVATRRVHFAGCTTNPDQSWMKQIAWNLTDCEDGFLNGRRFLIMDRDTQFTESFCGILEGEGVEAVKLPPRSPDLNPHIAPAGAAHCSVLIHSAKRDATCEEPVSELGLTTDYEIPRSPALYFRREKRALADLISVRLVLQWSRSPITEQDVAHIARYRTEPSLASLYTLINPPQATSP